MKKKKKNGIKIDILIFFVSILIFTKQANFIMILFKWLNGGLIQILIA